MITAGWVSSTKTTPMIIKKSWRNAKMNETGGSDTEANGTKSTTVNGQSPHPSGMLTNITVVDGADGLTPDMLRVDKHAKAREFTQAFNKQEENK